MDRRNRLHLLVIDDSTADVRVLQALLQQARPNAFQLVHCATPETGVKALESEAFDCVFLDYVLDDANGLDVVRTIRDSGNDVPIIAFSGCGNERVAVEALKLGAQDYLVKGELTPPNVERALSNAMEKVALARQLVEQQQELRNFAGVAAHDLRAPLRHIVTFAQFLQEDLAGNASEEVNKNLQVICSSARRMQQLVESLLEYTRVGRFQTPLEPVDLQDAAAAVMQNLEEVLQDANATIEVQELPTVKGDEVALIQLLQNLAANAIKFHGECPPVITIAAQEQQAQWQVSVADNGIGIDPKFFDVVFSPFRRLHTHKKYEGSGIGLATCRRIVDQHGGSIWVESQLGQGATFYFTLPKLEPTDDCPAEIDASSENLHSFADSC